MHMPMHEYNVINAIFWIKRKSWQERFWQQRSWQRRLWLP